MRQSSSWGNERLSLELWNILHDGTIAEIKGSLPEIALSVEIGYLRDMFSGQGEAFSLQLNHCRLFEYHLYEEPEGLTPLGEIALLEPEILMARDEDGVIVIGCTKGYLRCRYESFSIRLDTGMPVTFEALGQACKQYWENL
jgi:hypothetical protein